MNIRKLIREELEQLMKKSTAERVFDQDISYINGFELTKKEVKNNENVWVFEYKTKDYTIRFYVSENKTNESWRAKVFIYWKEQSRDFTNAKGKDYEYTFGPYSSYEEMIEDLNRKLKNNPLISSKNYFDDNKTQLDTDIFEMFKKLENEKGKLSKVKDKKFNDLKRLYNKVYKIQSKEELDAFLEKEYSTEADKRTLLLVLQKLFQLDFYLHKEELEGLF